MIFLGLIKLNFQWLDVVRIYFIETLGLNPDNPVEYLYIIYGLIFAMWDNEARKL